MCLPASQPAPTHFHGCEPTASHPTHPPPTGGQMGTNTSSHFFPTTWSAKVRTNTSPHTPTHQPTNHENAYNYAAHANINHAYTTCVHSGTKIIENHEFKYYHQRACNKICNNVCGIILDNLCCVICIIGHMPNWLASTSRNDFNNIWKVMFQLARGENIKTTTTFRNLA